MLAVWPPRVLLGAPAVRHVLKPADGLGQGFIMDFVAGETLGGRIVRDPRFAEVRPKLARQCGEILARIHAIPRRGRLLCVATR